MADLDSRTKRASSVNFLKPYALDLILPDGMIGQGDRQHIAWDYSGILSTAPVLPVPIQFVTELGTFQFETELN